MASFINGGVALRASAPKSILSKQLFVRMNGVGQKLPSLQVLQGLFQKHGTVEVPRPVEVKPTLPVLDVTSADLPMVYNFEDQRPKMMSNQAMGFLFNIGLSP